MEKENKNNKEDIQEPQNKEKDDLHSQILRMRADFDNFRKRAEKEKAEKYSAGKESVLSKVIGFIDIFEKAIEMTKQKHDNKHLLDGLELLKKEFMSFLEKEGVKSIKCEGEKFDPFLHESVGFELTDVLEEDNIIFKEVSKGYAFNERVLRVPKVIVFRKTAAAKPKEENDIKSEEVKTAG